MVFLFSAAAYSRVPSFSSLLKCDPVPMVEYNINKESSFKGKRAKESSHRHSRKETPLCRVPRMPAFPELTRSHSYLRDYEFLPKGPYRLLGKDC